MTLPPAGTLPASPAPASSAPVNPVPAAPARADRASAGPVAATELRHGYTLDSLTRLAHWAARRKRFDYGLPLAERYEVAWHAIAELLYAAGEPPAPGDLIHAAWRAIGQHHESRRQFLGLNHDGPPGPGNHFERYWRHVTRPADGPEDKLIERIALAQIWPRLTPASREALAALAAHGDYRRAADSLGMPYRSYVSRISIARRQFLALWHDGETPSRPWVRDRRAGPGTDMHTVTYFLRARRLRAAVAAQERPPGLWWKKSTVYGAFLPVNAYLPVTTVARGVVAAKVARGAALAGGGGRRQVAGGKRQAAGGRQRPCRGKLEGHRAAP